MSTFLTSLHSKMCVDNIYMHAHSCIHIVKSDLCPVLAELHSHCPVRAVSSLAEVPHQWTKHVWPPPMLRPSTSATEKVHNTIYIICNT